MIYSMNLYDILTGKEAIYSRYITEASQATAHLQNQGKIIAAGINPIKQIHGKTRSHFIVMEFRSLSAFETLLAVLDEQNISQLREQATENYIWTQFEPWDIPSWLSANG